MAIAPVVLATATKRTPKAPTILTTLDLWPRPSSYNTHICCRFSSVEEFRIIGFYLYHVTLIRLSNSIGASGSLTASLNIDYDRGSSSYYR